MVTPLSPTTRDRFDLDRLAEELVEREAHSGIQSNGLFGASAGALPIFVPLARDNEYLRADVFDAEDFLLSRVAHADLPDLRTELRNYLGTLKEELVELINDDYEAFISLSTDLRGEGETLVRLQHPLATLKETVLVREAYKQQHHHCSRTRLNRRQGRSFMVSKSLSRLS